MQPTVKGTSLLLLQKIEMSPFVTYSDLAFARKELPEGKKNKSWDLSCPEIHRANC